MILRGWFSSTMPQILWSHEVQNESNGHPCKHDVHRGHSTITITSTPLQTRRVLKALVIRAVALRTAKQRYKSSHGPFMATNALARVESFAAVHGPTGKQSVEKMFCLFLKKIFAGESRKYRLNIVQFCPKTQLFCRDKATGRSWKVCTKVTASG